MDVPASGKVTHPQHTRVTAPFLVCVIVKDISVRDTVALDPVKFGGSRLRTGRLGHPHVQKIASHLPSSTGCTIVTGASPYPNRTDPPPTRGSSLGDLNLAIVHTVRQRRHDILPCEYTVDDGFPFGTTAGRHPGSSTQSLSSTTPQPVQRGKQPSQDRSSQLRSSLYGAVLPVCVPRACPHLALVFRSLGH